MSVRVCLLQARFMGVEMPVDLFVVPVLVVMLDVRVLVEPVRVLMELVTVTVFVAVHLLLSRW